MGRLILAFVLGSVAGWASNNLVYWIKCKHSGGIKFDSDGG